VVLADGASICSDFQDITIGILFLLLACYVPYNVVKKSTETDKQTIAQTDHVNCRPISLHLFYSMGFDNEGHKQ